MMYNVLVSFVYHYLPLLHKNNGIININKTNKNDNTA